MSAITRLFDVLPALIRRDGKNYSPVVQKDCDGYFSAYYLEEDGGSFLYSNGAGYGTPEEALQQLLERFNAVSN